MAMKGEMNVRTKTVINNNITEQLISFNYLGYTRTVTNNTDLDIKMNRINQMCSTIRRTLVQKTRKQTQIESDKAMAVPVLVYEIWSITHSRKQKLKLQELNL
jgi:hypothetical protein